MFTVKFSQENVMINLHHQHQTQQGSVIFKETVLSYKSKRNLINYFINNNNTAILPSTTSTRRGLDRPLLTLVSNSPKAQEVR